MTASLAGALVVMAIIDSTSFGTLGVPVWMLVQPRVRVRAVLTYLATISVFYWLLGVLLLLGAGRAQEVLAGMEGDRTVQWVQLVVGIALFGISFLFSAKRSERRRALRGGVPSRHERWRDRVLGERAGTGVVMGLALLAGLTEAASMLPYLAAVGLLTTSGIPLAGQVGVLAGYVVVMAAPALALLAVRLTWHRRLQSPLERLSRWTDRNSQEILGWVLAIVGLLLASNAAQALGVWPFGSGR